MSKADEPRFPWPEWIPSTNPFIYPDLPPNRPRGPTRPTRCRFADGTPCTIVDGEAVPVPPTPRELPLPPVDAPTPVGCVRDKNGRCIPLPPTGETPPPIDVPEPEPPGYEGSGPFPIDETPFDPVPTSGVWNLSQLGVRGFAGPMPEPSTTVRVPRAPVPTPTRRTVPDIFAPSRTQTRPRMLPRVMAIPGMLIDEWLELWRQYTNPQPIPWPNANERTPRRPRNPRAPTAPEEWLPPESQWPDTVTQYPFWGPFPDWRPATGPSEADRPRPSERPATSPAPTSRPGRSPFPEPSYGDVPDPFSEPFFEPALPGPARAPAARPVPVEPEFPWPTELLPFSNPRSRPTSPSPRSRPTTRTQPRSPTQPTTTDPTFFNPPTQDPFNPTTPITADAPNVPNDPCRTSAADAKREQRKRRKECRRFKWKRIKVCADK